AELRFRLALLRIEARHTIWKHDASAPAVEKSLCRIDDLAVRIEHVLESERARIDQQRTTDVRIESGALMRGIDRSEEIRQRNPLGFELGAARGRRCRIGGRYDRGIFVCRHQALLLKRGRGEEQVIVEQARLHAVLHETATTE